LDYERWALATPATLGDIQEDFTPSAVDTGTSEITTIQSWVNNAKIRFTSTGTLPGGLTAGVDHYVLNAAPMTSPYTMQVALTLGGTAITLTTTGTNVHTIVPQETTTYTVASAGILTPPTMSPGSVGVIITPNDESILGTGADLTLANACLTYIDALRPVTASGTTVLPAIKQVEDVTISITPYTDLLAETIKADVTGYMNSLTAHETLLVAKLTAIAITDGATNAVVSLPTADVGTTTIAHIIRPGNIQVLAI
jgi:hypothetical protein